MIRSGEKGLTLVDQLMAVAVTGLIVSFLGTSIYQMLTVTGYGNDRLTAMHELQNTAHWLGLDGQKAVSAIGGDALELTLSDNSSVTYYLDGVELYRTRGGAMMTLARNISDIQFSVADRLITMDLTSSPPGRDGVSENGTYRVYLRVDGGQ